MTGTVDTKHPDYLDRVDEWALMRDCARGETAVKAAGGRPDNYSHDMDGITGTRRFWVRTLNRSGVPSDPIGPISATF